jgi:hypothetical protein
MELPWHMRFLNLILAASIAPAATIQITPLGATATQAVFQYCEPATATIGLTAYPAGLPSYVPHDVDSSLFPGSNLDSRIPGALVSGSCKILVLGAQTTAQGSDGNDYSRALQAATQHVLTLTAGSDSGSIPFTTVNPPLGNSSPIPAPFVSGSWGNYGWPSFSWTDQTKQYIDPNAGLLIKRITGPGQSYVGESANAAPYATDLAGVWTTPSNVLGNTGYASTSATGSANALFLPMAAGQQPGFTPNTSVDDVSISFGSAYASGSGGQISLCLSINHGQSCTGTPFTVSLASGSGAATSISGPSSFPSPLFAGWGQVKLTGEQITNLSGTIQVSGTTATFQTNDGFSTFFPLSTVSGDHILIAGASSTCPNNDCTIASLTNQRALSLNQNLGAFSGFSTTLSGGIAAGATTFSAASASGFIRSLFTDKYAVSFTDSAPETVTCSTLSGATFSGCSGTGSAHANGASMGSTAFTLTNFGVMVWNSGSGTVNLENASFQAALSTGFGVGDDGTANFCSVGTVTVQYAADGATALSPPETGRTCQLWDTFGNPALFLFVPQTGESRLIAYADNTKGYLTTGTFSPSDPNTVYYAQNNVSNPNVYQCVYNASAGKYAALAPNYTGLSSPNYSCTSMTSGAGNDILSQIGRVVTGFNASYFSRVSGFSPLTGNYIGVTVQGGQQNSIGYGCWFDVTQAAGSQVVGCHDTWTTYPQRWGGAHGTFVTRTNTGWGQIFLASLTSPGTTGIGEYQLSADSITGETGTTALTANLGTDPTTRNCATLGVTDARWIALGATGNNCIQMVVASEPQNVAPSAADKAQWPSACNAGYSQLQTIQPGDYLTDGGNPFGEQFLVALKTGSGCSGITLVLARGVNLQCAAAPTSHANGWIPILQATQQCNGNIYWEQASNPAVSYADPSNLDTGHTFIGQSDGGGTDLIQYTAYSALQGYNAYGARQGSLPSIIDQTYNYGMNMTYPFAGDVVNAFGNSIGNDIQSHPGGQSYLASPATLGYDGRPLGGAGGGVFDLQLWYHTLTLVSGQTNTYQITCPAAAVNGSCLDAADPKRLGWIAYAGRFLLQDISGPGSLISDSTPYAFCYAYNAGECRPGSAAGSRYVNAPNADTGGICYAAAPDRNAPCLAAGPAEAGQATEYSWAGNDPQGMLWRALGYGFNGAGVPPNYWNVHGIVDGSWVFTDVFWKEGVRKDIIAIQLPQWPPEDSVVRSDFVSIPVALNGQTGDSVRIRFGYNTNLFCTSRQEQCSTAGAAPYTWLSEAQTWTACSGSCEVDIPALGGRVLYYVVDRQSASGGVTSGTLQAVATP